MRISDWSSDVCSSDLTRLHPGSEQMHPDVQVAEARAESALEAGQDLGHVDAQFELHAHVLAFLPRQGTAGIDEHVLRDRKSVVEGKMVSVRVDLGGGTISKKKKTIQYNKPKSLR